METRGGAGLPSPALDFSELNKSLIREVNKSLRRA
jgi:hypothetical protein